jgi:hypothetical protein
MSRKMKSGKGSCDRRVYCKYLCWKPKDDCILRVRYVRGSGELILEVETVNPCGGAMICGLTRSYVLAVEILPGTESTCYGEVVLVCDEACGRRLSGES